jgi:hypothetical protein
MLLLAACGATSGSSSSQRPVECGTVVSDLFARSNAVAMRIWGDLQPEVSKQLASMLDTITPVVIRSCRDDRWSPAVLECLAGMAVTDDPHKCNHLFTTDQAVGLTRRIVVVMTRVTR